MKFDRNKLLTSVSAVALVLAVGACSSSSDDDGSTAAAAQEAALAAAAMTAEAERMTALADAATAAAAAQEMALADAATAAEAAKMMALADAATAAEAAKMMALADAATAAEAAKMMALADAATAAEAAKMMALADAATAAEAAKMMALADAATAAEAAKMMALADAATAAEAAKMMALADAATAAEAAKMMALADAATLAGEDKAEALRLADVDQVEALRLAGIKAGEDQVEALRLAGIKAGEDQVEALRLAGIKAGEDQVEALRLAGIKAGEDQVEALRLAGIKAGEDQVEALRLGGIKAGEDQVEALRLAGIKAGEDQVEALRLAGVEADAKLMAANSGLMAALQELDLDPANDTMSVEDQIAANTATLKNALALVEDELADAMKAENLAGRIARAGMVLASIGEAPPGGINPNPMPTAGSSVTGVTAERDAAGMVTVDLNGDVDDDYAGGETNAGSSAWNNVTMTKTNAADDSTDTVVVYTDIAAPADADFGTEYPSTTNFLAGPTGDDAKGNVKKARSDNFPSGASQSLVYSTVSGNPLSFRGTFDDVPGVFTCAAVESCTLMTDPKGVLMGSADGDTWGFTPDAPNSATVKKPAEAYTYFGWWLNKPVKADDAHMVEVFAGGVGDAAMIDGPIVGTARYMGPAAGKYATKTFVAGVQTDAAVGHFTATANLTAKFGNADDPGEGISGTVTGFELDDLTSVPWKVTLEEAMYNQANFAGTTEVDFGGGLTAADDDDPTGRWQGTFYGRAADAADAPSTVVGTFGAQTLNASLLGAFGATKQ